MTSGQYALALQDEATLQGLAQCDSSTYMRRCLQCLHDCLFNHNLFASIDQEATVRVLHATAEEVEPAAADGFGTFQVF